MKSKETKPTRVCRECRHLFLIDDGIGIGGYVDCGFSAERGGVVFSGTIACKHFKPNAKISGHAPTEDK